MQLKLPGRLTRLGDEASDYILLSLTLEWLDLEFQRS